MPLKSNISKKDMTEEDIKNRFVTPALNQAGWESGLILMEKYFTAGRILVPTKGKRHAKKDGNKADYILFAEPNLPIAIVEAKDNNQPVSGGIQQAIRYAEILDLPFAFSTNDLSRNTVPPSTPNSMRPPQQPRKKPSSCARRDGRAQTSRAVTTARRKAVFIASREVKESSQVWDCCFSQRYSFVRKTSISDCHPPTPPFRHPPT